LGYIFIADNGSNVNHRDVIGCYRIQWNNAK